MTSHGDGVYRSTDAGRTWTHLGLDRTRHISRIRVHPTDPDTVLVAAQGAAYGASQDRGVYRSTDGGKTWDRVLFVNDTTGPSELAMDPANPRILYAAMWDHLRQPWQVRSGGPGSGIHKSTDGGATWQRVMNGMPGTVGKIGIDVSANPDRLYAVVEADPKGGLYRSDDGAKSWQLVNDAWVLHTRAWYYMKVFADPKNPDVVWVLNANVSRSIDGGKTFTNVRTPHGDNHSLWINPHRSRDAHRGQRRRRERVVQRRPHLVHAGQPADGAVLSRQRRQPVPLQRLRRPAGQHLGEDRQRRRRRHHRTRLVRRRRLRERRAGLRPRQAPLRLRRLLHGDHQRVRRRDEDRARRDGLAADAGGGGAERAEVPLQLERADRRLALQPVGDLSRRQRAAAVGQPRQDVARGQPGPDAQRQEQAGARRRARSPTKAPAAKPTASSTTSPNRRTTPRRSGWAPTTVSCSSRATRARRGATSRRPTSARRWSTPSRCRRTPRPRPT